MNVANNLYIVQANWYAAHMETMVLENVQFGLSHIKVPLAFMA